MGGSDCRLMRRRLFNVIAALSLLACIAVAGVWVRSYWVSDRLVWQDFGALTVDRGTLSWVEVGGPSIPQSPERFMWVKGAGNPVWDHSAWSRQGFVWIRETTSSGSWMNYYGAPAWFILL